MKGKGGGFFEGSLLVVEITFSEWTTAVERMSGVAFGAAADGFVVLDAAVGVVSTSSWARIGALEIEAGEIAGAFLVLGALRVAARERIAQEVGRARADGAMVLQFCFHISIQEIAFTLNWALLEFPANTEQVMRDWICKGNIERIGGYRNAALGVGAAWGAGIVAAEVDASPVGTALEVALTLVFAAVDRVAEEAVATRAHGACVLHPAVGVVTTRRRRAEIRTFLATFH